ncbi:hypothetical protein GDO81_007463 [Engystomops pustulosus]|uniref:Uncharacterized protein n=1 Tax=Engystomops pustulosus TaxID=76066 RepID=A0AAV7C895_ENGPU|nr:hypothetical protein GDO81_007463 [Engystomops pustulosus]
MGGEGRDVEQPQASLFTYCTACSASPRQAINLFLPHCRHHPVNPHLFPLSEPPFSFPASRADTQDQEGRQPSCRKGFGCSFFPGPGSWSFPEHHVCRGRFWKPTEEIQAGLSRRTERRKDVSHHTVYV